MSQAGEDDVEGEGTAKKTERKREREKQRRGDLSNAFDELAAVLSRIEPDEADRASTSNKKRKKSIGEAGDGDASGTTRLDLVVRTVDILKKLHADNVDLRHGSPREKGNDQEVLVMVPTLTSVDDSDQNRALAASYPTYYQHQSSDQTPLSDRQSDPQPDQRPPQQSLKHPYPQPYQHFPQQYRQQHPYPPQQEYPGNIVTYYSGLPHGHPPYGQSWVGDAGQYPQNQPGPYSQYPPLSRNGSSHGHSRDEDDESHHYAKK